MANIKSNVAANIKFSAVHICFVNPKFYFAT